MIESISLTNFKGFKRLENLKIKPVTVLCGVNSSGKSSVLQSILLAKQTVESQNPGQILVLNGRYVHLGAFANIIFSRRLTNVLSLGFSFRVSRENLNREMIYLMSRMSALVPRKRVMDKLRRVDEYRLVYEFDLAGKERKPSLSEAYVTGVKTAAWGIRRDGSMIPGTCVELNLIDGDRFSVKWQNLTRDPFIWRGNIGEDVDVEEGESQETVTFSNMMVRRVHSLERNMGVGNAVYYMGQLFSHVLSSYRYIGPLREEPSRRYVYEDEVVDIGVRGENAAYIYLTEQNNQVGEHWLLDHSGERFVQRVGSELGKAVDSWLRVMGMNGFEPELVREVIYLSLDSGVSDTRVSIADVGFGVSQIFPIVLEGLRMPKGNTLLLEQPEIHLHPNLQMRLADFFIALALSGKKVIVETHSDHVVNRLVRRIVEDEKHGLKDLIAIYFFNPSTDGCVCEEVQIDETRGIVNWPRDFFDQTATEQERIMRAGLERRMKKRRRTKGEEQ